MSATSCGTSVNSWCCGPETSSTPARRPESRSAGPITLISAKVMSSSWKSMGSAANGSTSGRPEMPVFGGLRAVVTGGASGIGLTTARLLAAEGATVAVLDREPLADAEHDHLRFVQADVADDTAVRRAVEAAISQLGGLDILVNNAGIG